ncbi:MAG: signal peptidase II, partial [Alphaproteobacteria bacterium]|nr:signal peptidase II [Alphaproteobacteria bacterium]
VSFGLLGGGGDEVKLLLTGFALAVAAVLPFIARNWDRLSITGALMMAGGALGNGIDRVIHGRVVDFIDVFAGQYHWPAFNIADMSVCTGAGLLLLAAVRERRHGNDQGSDDDPSTKGDKI